MKYDVFIAYHGTNKENSSYSKAREIGKYLLDNGFSPYVHGYISLSEDDGLPYTNTPDITKKSNLFLLVINDELELENNKIKSKHIRKEISTFKGSNYGNFDTNRINGVYYGSKIEEASAFIEKLDFAFNGTNILGKKNSYEDILNWVKKCINDTNKVKNRSRIYEVCNVRTELLTNMYINLYINPNLAYKQLPIEKLVHCIYATVSSITHTSPISLVIEDFKRVYIEKKIYRYESGEKIKNLLEEINYGIDKYYSLCGVPGCGKSTYLYSIFIDCIENFEVKKLIPVFVDLKSKNRQNVLDEIKEKLLLPLKNICLFLEDRLDDIIDNLKLLGYKFIFILDSYDEVSFEDKKDSLASVEFNNDLISEFNNSTNVKYLCAMRTYAYDSFASNNQGYRRNSFELKDFSYQEAQIFIEQLNSVNIIDETQKEKLLNSLLLLRYNSRINPFLASKVVENVLISTERKLDKIVDLLFLTDEEITHNPKKDNIIDEQTYWIIGIRKQVNYSEDKLCDFLNYPFDRYERNLNNIKINTYLLDKDNYYYQQLYSDFYSAMYIINTFKDLNNVSNEEYINRIFFSQLDNIDSKAEVFSYITLIIEREMKLKKYSDTILKKIFDYICNNYSSKEKWHNIFILYSEIIKTIDRYSSQIIIKDEKPISIDATYFKDRILEHIFIEFFRYIFINNCDVDYDDFYYVINSADKLYYISKALYKLIDEFGEKTNMFFKILSIIRDSYSYLYYLRNNDFLNLINNVNIRKYFLNLYPLATNNKKISEMNLRELLNASFYSLDKISIDEINKEIDLSICYFPTIYNLNLYIDCDVNKNNEVTLVDDSSNLLFNYKDYCYKTNHQYKAITFINQNDFINHKLNIPNNVRTLCVYGENKLIDIYNTMNGVKTIDISQNFLELSEKCFSKALSLENIILPNKLEKIDKFALYENNNLKNIIIPNNVKYLGESFIEDCFILKNLVIPENVIEIHQYSFEECNLLESVIFKTNKLKLIDEGIFKGCKGINTPINLSNLVDLVEVGNFAFIECTQLPKIIFPKNLKKLGTLVFDDCINLNRIEFMSSSLDYISNYSFGRKIYQPITLSFGNEEVQISNISDVYKLYPKYVKHINEDLTYRSQTYEKIQDGYRLVYTTKDIELVKYDSSQFDFKITSLDIGALGDMEYLDEVILGNTVTELSEWAFEDCISLRYVNMEKSNIHCIEGHAFENCESLTHVILPKGKLEIKESAFENCNSIVFFNPQHNSKDDKNILYLSNNITKVEANAFKYCSKITKIIIENPNIIIEPYAFSDMENLQEISIPEELADNIPEHAFFNCNNLKLDCDFDEDLFQLWVE